MSDFNEVQKAYNLLRSSNFKNFAIMQCTGNYPTQIEEGYLENLEEERSDIIKISKQEKLSRRKTNPSKARRKPVYSSTRVSTNAKWVRKLDGKSVQSVPNFPSRA